MPNLQPITRKPFPASPPRRTPRRLRARRASILATGALAATICLSSHATTITVNTTNGGNITVNGNCSLAEATVAANFNVAVDTCPAGSGVDTIAFAPSIFSANPPFAATITLQQSLNLSDAGVTIEPPAGKSLIIQGSGGNGLFTVTKGNHNFRRLTLSAGTRNGGGGAIGFSSPTETVSVELDQVSAINNVGTGPGGAIGGTVGTGIVNLNIFNSSFTSNTSTSFEPGIGGGAIGFDVGSGGFLGVLVENSVFSFNDGFECNGGALSLRHTGNNGSINLDVSHSVFNNNSARSGGAFSFLNSSPSNTFFGRITDSRFSDNIGGVSATTATPGAGAIDVFGAVEPAATSSKLQLRRNSFIGNNTDNGVGAAKITFLGSELTNNLFANNSGLGNMTGGLELDYDGPGNLFTSGDAIVRANTFYQNSGNPKDMKLDMPLIGMAGAGDSDFYANVVQGTQGGNSNCVINNFPGSGYNATNLDNADCTPGLESLFLVDLQLNLTSVTHPTHTVAAIPAFGSPVIDLWPEGNCYLAGGANPDPMIQDMLGPGRRDPVTGLPPDGDGNGDQDCDAGSIEYQGLPFDDTVFANGFD